MASDTDKVKIYVRLLDEGTEVSRPTDAVDIGNGLYRLLPDSTGTYLRAVAPGQTNKLF